MFKKILIAIIVSIIAFLIVVAVQPSEFRVTRSATLTAAPADVFSQVNDFHKWQAWSPWAKLDPAAKNSFEGPESGNGAVFRWAGNRDVGEGKMTITESRPNDLIRFNLEFFQPMAGMSFTEFNFKPEGTGTHVTWTMSGQNNFIAKAFCLFVSMDKMVGGQFEQGLSTLNSIGAAKP